MLYWASAGPKCGRWRLGKPGSSGALSVPCCVMSCDCVHVCVCVNKCELQYASYIERERCSRGLGYSRECWIKDVKSSRFIFDVGSKRETITNQRAPYWLCSKNIPECLFMIQISDLREYLWIWMHWGHSPISSIWGTIKGWVHCDCALSIFQRHPS